MTESIDPGSLGEPHYWLGMLSQTVRGAIEDVEALRGPDALRALKRSLAEYEASPVHRPREIVSYAVVDALGECYAMAADFVEAYKRKAQAEDYLFEAQSCGHPKAGPWVRERLPLRVLTVDADERDALLEDGTPVLEREP